MGRHRTRYHWFWNSGSNTMTPSFVNIRDNERQDLHYRNPYSVMVGGRIKRLRQTRGMTQAQALQKVRRPAGGLYSQGFLSRIEKGYANPPLYAYIHIATALEVEPGRLLGSDETQKPITEAEMTLVRFLRRIGIGPDEAIARLAVPSS